jgi:hypothetical protein
MTIPPRSEADMTPYASLPEIINAVKLMSHAFRPDEPQRRESEAITNVWDAILETAVGYDYMRGFTAASERWHQLATTVLQPIGMPATQATKHG